MARTRDRRPQRKSRGGRRRAVPRGLGMALGMVALLMVLAYAAVRLRDCREGAALSSSQR